MNAPHPIHVPAGIARDAYTELLGAIFAEKEDRRVRLHAAFRARRDAAHAQQDALARQQMRVIARALFYAIHDADVALARFLQAYGWTRACGRCGEPSDGTMTYDDLLGFYVHAACYDERQNGAMIAALATSGLLDADFGHPDFRSARVRITRDPITESAEEVGR